jgi:hypothetical protein
MKAVEHGFSNCDARTTTGVPSIIYTYEALAKKSKYKGYNKKKKT